MALKTHLLYQEAGGQARNWKNQKIRVYTLLGDTKELAEETTERVEGEQNLRKGLEMRRHSEKTAVFSL